MTHLDLVETVHNNTQRWHPLLTALVEFEVVLRLFFILRNGTERVAETLALFLVLLKDTEREKRREKEKVSGRFLNVDELPPLSVRKTYVEEEDTHLSGTTENSAYRRPPYTVTHAKMAPKYPYRSKSM